ncbi:peroxidasin homolog [Cydia strobilella]|uniref:peroxidasin homolog n=1 Tax=Cydia strobilella TaxID=1100964 RepID=UPI00300763D9
MCQLFQISVLYLVRSGDGLESRTEDPQFPAASALRQSPLLQHCPLRGAPKCPPASKRYRTHDGTCNNVNRPRWGSTMTPVQRFLPPSYSDGIQAPRRSVFGSALPSAREISSTVHEDQHVETPGITHLLMQWGQFLDHDVTSSSQSRGFNGSVPRCCKDGGRDFVPREFLHPECMPIEVPPSDPFYGPKGVRCLDFVRSSPAPRDDCALGWREQMNQVSAYIDGSPLYASSARQSDKLRLFRNGMLQYGRVQNRRPLLPPERRDELCRGGAVSSDCFKSGDARVNEHPGLVAAHIVWLRQHNRMAQELAHLNPHWSDEKVYQETRKIVGAMIQHITYREFLPIVLGQEVMRLFDLEPLKKGYYKGYSPKINPSPASSFSSAAFRFGHSLVQPSMVRYDRFHRPMQNNVSLHDELTNPSNIWSMGAVDRLLLGMVNQPIQKRDEFITEELTNHLFQTPSFDFGMDLAAINIQRGRDHGIAPYTAWREPCGLSPINEFEDLFRVMSPRAVRRLQSLYRHVDDIDLFTAGMSERPVVGGLVGPTFACIIAQQFSNLRKGDRFWYENGGFESSLTPAQLQQIRRISFAQILCRTLDTIDSIQPFVFLSADNTDNDRISCLNGLLNNFDLSPWTDVNSSNDISKSDDVSTERPKRKTTTTTKRSTTKHFTTKKPQKFTATSKTPQKKPVPVGNNTHNAARPKPTHRPNKTDSINDKSATLTDKDVITTTEQTVQKIDDKLDFKNKSLRYEEADARRNNNKPTKQYGNDYDDDEEVHSVQSVVINNLQHKRPYNRPVIAVTENIDKYTYLINYVPRPTQSWRGTTRRTTTRRLTTRRTHDRDVVKVTYQSYDDTYGRPNKPYYYNRYDDRHDNYNRQDDKNDNYDKQDNNNDNYNRQDDNKDDYNIRLEGKEEDYSNRQNRPNTKENNFSSARSNDKLQTSTTKTDATIDKISVADNIKLTTVNPYKLVTFGYVGTYKGDTTNDKETKTDSTETIRHEVISKDFSTYEDDRLDTDEKKNMKLSTFFHYETATKPYNNLRPTRRYDEDQIPDYSKTNSKYYFVRNVLRKYPDSTFTDKAADETKKKEILKENYNSPGQPVPVIIEERSSADKLALLEEAEEKSAIPDPERLRVKITKPSSPAKTPSVAFQVIPSENNPSQWATYAEKDLPEGLPHRMPPMKIDPYALKEIPRPFNFGNLRRRHSGKNH